MLESNLNAVAGEGCMGENYAVVCELPFSHIFVQNTINPGGFGITLTCLTLLQMLGGNLR